MGCVRLCATAVLVTDIPPVHVGVVKCHCYLALSSLSALCSWLGGTLCLAAGCTCKWECSTCAHHPALDNPELQSTQAGHQHLARRNPLVLCWSLQHPLLASTFIEIQMNCKPNNHFLIKAPQLSILQEIPLLRVAEADLIPPFAKALTR